MADDADPPPFNPLRLLAAGVTLLAAIVIACVPVLWAGALLAHFADLVTEGDAKRVWMFAFAPMTAAGAWFWLRDALAPCDRRLGPDGGPK